MKNEKPHKAARLPATATLSEAMYLAVLVSIKEAEKYLENMVIGNLDNHKYICFNMEWQLATYKENFMASPKVVDPTKNRNKNREQPSRLNFRLAPEVKARVARAAALAGQDLTEFAVAALQEKADETIQKHESLFLSAADYEFFLNALDSGEDRQLSEKSIRAAERYRQGTRKGVRYSLLAD